MHQRGLHAVMGLDRLSLRLSDCQSLLVLTDAESVKQQTVSSRLAQVLDFGSNNFTGNLSVIEGMPLATEFRFDGNALTGSLPLISHNVQVSIFVRGNDLAKAV